MVSPIPLPPNYLFVPFQVRLDSQVLLHSPWIQGMRELFRVMTEALYLVSDQPPIALVFKEHPSCPFDYSDLHARAHALPEVLFANGNSTEELIRGSSGVVTLNSSVGCEALLLGRPVLALGNAVYEIPGVVSSARTVDEVVGWMRRISSGSPPPAPLRESFLRYLSEEFLIPDRHQSPGEAHFDAVRARLRSPAERTSVLRPSLSRVPPALLHTRLLRPRRRGHSEAASSG